MSARRPAPAASDGFGPLADPAHSKSRCLRYIPEVSSSLQKYVGSAANPDREVIFAMRDLVGELERSNAAVEVAHSGSHPTRRPVPTAPSRCLLREYPRESSMSPPSFGTALPFPPPKNPARSLQVTPFKFVQLFRTAFPMFAQQAEGGRGFLQQDAEECWSTLINMLSQRLVLPVAAEVLHPPLQPIPSPSRTHVSDTYLSTKEIDPRYTGHESSEPASLAQPSDLGTGQPALLPGMSALRRNLGDMLFGVEMECNYKCTETDAEPAHSARESVRESCRNSSCKLSTRVEVVAPFVYRRTSAGAQDLVPHLG